MSLQEAAKSLRERANLHLARYPTGFSGIDERCGVPKAGELSLFWARTGTGKTTLLLNMVTAYPNIPTILFNLEMGEGAVLSWLTAMTQPDMPVQAQDMEDVLGNPDHSSYMAVQDALDSTVDMFPHLHVLQPTRPNVHNLAEMVQEISDEDGHRGHRVLIDHLGLLEGVSSYEATLEATSTLKYWAKEMDLGLMVLQQTGRAGDAVGKNDGHLPVTISSGLYAGEHDADYIYGFYRPEMDPALHKEVDDPVKDQQRLDRLAAVRGQGRLQLVKNRPTGLVNMEGIVLHYNQRSRTYHETGTFPQHDLSELDYGDEPF